MRTLSERSWVKAAGGRFESLPRDSMLVALLAGGLLALILTMPKAFDVWSTGIFLDPDDAMRAVELRDFMAGQSWFDLVPHRLSPDHPFVMHWSRLVDWPLSLMVRFFRMFTAPERAERLMRLVEPNLLFVVSLWAVLRITLALIGPRALLPAALLLATSIELLGNFIPGHIHHHDVQATLLLLAAQAMLENPDSKHRDAKACTAGVICALSLGVGLQNLPFIVGLLACTGMAWIARGEQQSRPLAAFGLGLAVSAAAVFAADVPPWRYGEGACDAFSTVHLIAAVGVGAVLAGLASLSRHLRTPFGRATAASAGAVAVVLVLGLTFPACLRDPMAGVDPLLRTDWLAGVGEAQPLGRLIAAAPADGLALLFTLLAGLSATILAAMRAPAETRDRWYALLLLSAVGTAGSLWQVRVAASTCAFLIPGITWVVRSAYDRLSRRPGFPALLTACALGFFGNGAGWTALAGQIRTSMPSGSATAPAADASGSLYSCFEPASFATLRSLPPGLVLSTIDPGSAILAYTPHAALAAPYHRNTYGNRVSLLALKAPPDAARSILRDAKVRYVALCRSSNETAETIGLHPDSLSAALMLGRIPDWLTPVSGKGEAFLLFRMD